MPPILTTDNSELVRYEKKNVDFAEALLVAEAHRAYRRTGELNRSESNFAPFCGKIPGFESRASDLILQSIRGQSEVSATKWALRFPCRPCVPWAVLIGPR